jgi:hypothetical protein
MRGRGKGSESQRRLYQKWTWWQLKGLQNKWVTRGVRKAYKFQLVQDPENAEKGKQEHIEMASVPNQL